MPDAGAGVPVGPDRDLTAEARIRRAGLTLFGQRGYEATSLREIADLAGVSKTLVAHHFGTKDNLRDHIDRDVLATVKVLFSQLIPNGRPMELTAFADSYRRLFADHPDVTEYMRRSILEPTPGGSRLLRLILDLIEAILEQMIAEGAIARPNDMAATLVLQASLGLTAVLLGPALGDYLDSDEPLESRLARAEVELALNSFLNPLR